MSCECLIDEFGPEVRRNTCLQVSVPLQSSQDWVVVRNDRFVDDPSFNNSLWVHLAQQNIVYSCVRGHGINPTLA